MIFPGPYVVAWKKGIAVLSAGNVKVSPDPRISLVNGHSLEIKEVTTQDAGDYVCQIGTLEPREITHTVEVLGKSLNLSYDHLVLSSPITVTEFMVRNDVKCTGFTRK